MTSLLVRNRILLASLLGALLVPSVSALVSDAGMFEQLPPLFPPEGPGVRMSLEWDFLDQGQNWSGNYPSSTINLDKDLTTNWLKAGAQLQFDRSWALRTAVPLGVRSLQTTSQGNGQQTFTRVGLGDVQILGEFSGLWSDHSTTLRAGLKLPTGSSSDSVIGPSYRLGTGSTDLLVGLEHFGQVGEWPRWVWTMELLWRQPIVTQNGFVPGAEIDQSFGITYRDLFINDVSVVPVVQLVTAYRWNDRVPSNGSTDPVADNSGYSVYSVAPGVAFGWDTWRVVTNLGIPLYQNVNGNQLVAPFAFQTQISYGF